MRDSLDLGLLQSQIIAERKAAWRTWAVVITLSLILGLLFMGFLAASVPISTASRRSCSPCSTAIINLAIAIIPAFVVWGAIIAFAVNWRRRRNRTNKVRQQLPQLTLPPPIKLYDNELVIGGVVILLGVGLIFRLDFGAVLFLILPLCLIYILAISIVGIWVRSPLQDTDYDEIIRRVRVVSHFLKGNIGILGLEGAALIFAGKSVESEQVHRQFLAQSQKVKAYGISHNLIKHCLLADY